MCALNRQKSGVKGKVLVGRNYAKTRAVNCPANGCDLGTLNCYPWRTSHHHRHFAHETAFLTNLIVSVMAYLAPWQPSIVMGG
jgi:hypothetical protein